MHDVLVAVALPWLNAFALAMVPIVGGIALTLLRKHNIDTTWFEAIGRAGGAAYANMVASGKPVTDKAALAAAAAAGGAYLQERMAPLIASKGLTPDAVAQIAGAELGKLLAVDPGAVVGGGGSVTATAAPGQTATAEVGPTPVVVSSSKIIAALLTLAIGGGTSGCTQDQVGAALSDVRLFCKTKDMVVALATVTGTPVLAQGQTSAYVGAACDAVSGKPIALTFGALPGAVLQITPPAVTVPLEVEK